MDGVTRGRGLLLAVVTAAFAAACGSSESAAPDSAELPPLGPVTAAAPVTGTPTADAARLREQLLTTANLPPNFTALPTRADAPAGVKQTAPTDPAECATVLTPLGAQRSGALATAAVQYAGPSFSSIDIDAASFPNDAVASAFSDVQATLRRCTHYSGADATDIPIDYRVCGFAPPQAGDAVTAFEVRATSDGLTLHSSVAIVQVGSTLAQVAVTAPEPVDARVLSDLTAAQVRRLHGVSGP
ncbi:hypothetical protein [Nocardia iowensis]|uniref:hypothetical protein n=1 Tax=Nocardia iowensis TaxID=204891 RepID=UPI001FE4D398|nr:hypothetical protein [Nocardia iowensis]